MSQQGLTMRTTREVLRLGLTTPLSFRDIGRSLQLSHPTVQKYIHTAKSKELTWEQIQGLSDDELRTLMAKPEPAPRQISGRRWTASIFIRR